MYDLKKKIIFTHPQKCGGTSIESLLGFLTLRDKNPNIQSIKHASLKTHYSKIESKGLDPSTFFKFSIIRNPWCRAISFYNHLKHQEYNDFLLRNKSWLNLPRYIFDARMMTFKDFSFKYYKSVFNSEVSTKPFMVINDTLSLDYVIKLENLKEDLSLIKDKLQIPLLDIPRLNNSDKYTDRKNYTDYYDKQTINLIYHLFEWDINYFNYEFEDDF